MKKWTLRILLCLILGVVTTVSVAWTCTALAHRLSASRWMPFPDPSHLTHTWGRINSLPVDDQRWIRSHDLDRSLVVADTTWTVWEVEVHKTTGFRRTWFARGPDGFFEGQSLPEGTHTRAGWPCSAVHGSRRMLPDGAIVQIGILPVPDTTNLGPLGEFASFDLAYIPEFPGFLVNTLFYAAIWFGLFLAAGRTRRFIRTRRGRCPRCGYDLQKNLADGCPECGWGRDTHTGDEGAAT